MIVVFNGIVEKRPKGGCKCRGGSSESSFSMRKMFILPSGRTHNFVRGVEVEVSDSDGEFLLGYSYVDKDGTHRDSFTKVSD